MDGNSEYCWLMLINCKPLQAAFGVTWRWISFLIISGLDDRFACQWAGTCLVWGLIQICLETVKVLHSQETLKLIFPFGGGDNFCNDIHSFSHINYTPQLRPVKMIVCK